MPTIPVTSQLFDIAFDPTRPIVHGALLEGRVQSFRYGYEDDGGWGEDVASSSASSSSSGSSDSDDNEGEGEDEGGASSPPWFPDEDEDEEDANEEKKQEKDKRPKRKFKYETKMNLKLSKKSCRSLDVNGDGRTLWVVGRSKAMFTVDVEKGVLVDTRKRAHDAAINRIKRLTDNLLATGDDDGVVKLWDPRKREAINTYTHHFDFISDFLWVDDKKQLVCTSGDGTLSVIDVRSKKNTPFAQSEDQEDELLSIVAIKGGSKLLIGTQSGTLTLFSPRHGYADCVTRIPGHPHSVDALCAIPSRYPNAGCTVLTGSSDGVVRVVEVGMGGRLVGVVCGDGHGGGEERDGGGGEGGEGEEGEGEEGRDGGEGGGWPVERVKVEKGGEGRWVGCVGHEEVLRMVDLVEVFEDGDGEGADGGEDSEDEGKSEDDSEGVEKKVDDHKDEEQEKAEEDAHSEKEAEDSDSDSDEPTQTRKRKKKQDKDRFRASKKGKGRNELAVGDGFFADL